MEPLKIATINVNGINTAVRRRAFFEKMRKGGFDIGLFQECHSVAATAGIWRSEWGARLSSPMGLPTPGGS